MDKNQNSNSTDQLTREDKNILREFFDLLHKIDQRELVIQKIKDRAGVD